MDLKLKEKREKFITGHQGGSFSEVIILTLLLPLSHILYTSFVLSFPILQSINDRRIIFLRYGLDFFLNYSPFILAVTVLSSQINQIFFTLILLIVINFLRFYIRNRNLFAKTFQLSNFWKRIGDIELRYDGKKLPYVSNLMSSLLMATCIAILAVDFPLFHRRFAKTEIYGWSLMDVGVGGFIAINGALSPESRLAHDSQISVLGRVRKSILSTLPLLILGILRLVSVKSLNYQEHLTEYGYHWNFFFTIAFTKIFSSIMCAIFHKFCINYFIIAIALSAFHQCLLTKFGWTEFILNSDRGSLIAANKEGLISCIGFVALYLFFVQYGRNYLPKRKIISEFLKIFAQVLGIYGFACGAMFISHSLVENVSRREANFAFLAFMIAFISIHIVVELIYFLVMQIIYAQALTDKFDTSLDSSTLKKNGLPDLKILKSLVFGSISETGLLIFLSANVLTGLVNFVFDTLHITSVTFTLTILLMYAMALTTICLIFKRFSIKI